jgi:3-oxoacyl-[acyl-carrier-protein] synthase-3
LGCPGWIEGVLQANAYIKSGMERCLVIGSGNLSRVGDINDEIYDFIPDGRQLHHEASDDENWITS